MTRLEQLKERLAQLSGNMDALAKAAAADQANMTVEQQKQFETYDAEFQDTDKEIGRLERVEAALARTSTIPVPKVIPAAPRDGFSDQTPVPASGRPSFSGGERVAHGFQNHGFDKGFGEYLGKVREAKIGGTPDPRLKLNTITTFGGEGVGADGGYALPPQFATEIWKAVLPEDSFLTALSPIVTSSNLLVIPKDETTPWGSTGVTAAKTAEGAAITATKPSIGKVQIVMHSIKSLVHVSEESLSDIPFLASYVQNKMAEKIRYKLENYVMNGTGEDEPLGIMNSPGLYALAENSTAATISAFDVFAMKAATLPGPGAFWVVSPTILPAIWALKTDATAGYPLFAPDMTKAPEGTLLGLPMYRSETCAAINTTAGGDIVLVVPNGYILATAGGIQAAATIGFAFDQDLQSFRATLRAGGSPTLSNKVTRANGSTYASNLITLLGNRN